MMNLKNIKLVVVAILMSVTLSSCAQKTAKKEVESTKTIQKQPIVELISPTALNAALGDIQLIDVRTPKEYNGGHIKDAVNINFYDDNFITQISKLDKDKEIYIYCRSGSRSGRAASKLKAAGFTKVYDLQGGFINWNNNNLETTK